MNKINKNKSFKLGIISLGCAKNLVDSELFLGLCEKYKLEITNKINNADIICINTCGFIESAKEESINTIMEIVNYKEDNPNLKIIVIGCLVQRYYDILVEEIPEVDYYIPIRDYDKLDDVFMKLTNSNISYKFSYTNRVISTGNYKAYIRIGDGCDNKCSYCAIPLIRGKYKSREIEDILNECEYLAKKGIKELTIISQDTTKYGIDLKDVTFANLLEEIAKKDLFEIIRVLYMYPDEITDELLNVFKKYDKIANYFDIPIQHASNSQLKAMNRRGSIELITNLINKIRAMFSDAIIRTTLIVGFPGETDEDFSFLCEKTKELRFERMGAFTYSDEEDTKGYELPNKVLDQIKIKRYNTLMSIQENIAKEFNNSRVGKKYKVIVDGYDQNKKMYMTRSYAEAPDDADGYIYVKGDFEIGSIIEVEIIDVLGYDTVAKLI